MMRMMKMRLFLFLSILLQAILSHGGRLINIPWTESIFPEAHDHILKTKLYELNSFLTIFNEITYQEIHQRESYLIEQKLSCYMNDEDQPDLHPVEIERRGILGDLERYLFLLRIYYLTYLEIYLFQYPDGDFPNSMIFSLQDELSTWQLFLQRLEDLKNFEYHDQVESLNCIDAYKVIAEKIVNMLEELDRTHENVCQRLSEDCKVKEENSDCGRKAFKTLIPHAQEKNGKSAFIASVLFDYQEKSLYPFLRSSSFCALKRPFILFRSELVRNDSVKTFSSSGDDDAVSISHQENAERETLFITQKCTNISITSPAHRKDLQLSVTRQSKSPLNHQLYQFCFRRMYVSFSNQTLERLLDPENAGGSMTQRAFYCPSSTLGENCVVATQLPLTYDLVLLAGLFFSPQPLLLGSTRGLQTAGRTLLAGLGAGELNTFLTTYFPYIAFDHVELRETVIKATLHHFRFRDFVCDSYQLVRKDKPVVQQVSSSGESDSFIDNSFALEETSHLMNISKQDSCKSNIIHADMFDYFRWWNHLLQSISYFESYINRFSKSRTEEEYLLEVATIRSTSVLSDLSNITQHAGKLTLIDLYYDYIEIDIFDAITMTWDGTEYEGESNSDRYHNSIIFDQIKSILRPYTGIAVFHLHRDQYFKTIFHQIIKSFGASQVLLLEIVSNDAVIVAARDRWRKPPSSSLNFLDSEEEELKEHTIYERHLLYRSHVHPCESPFQSLLERKRIVKQLNFVVNPWMMYEYSLNCVNLPTK